MEVHVKHVYQTIQSLEQCDSFYQFPSIPILFGHVRFFYNNSHWASNPTKFLLPNYVCYDQQLCDCLIPTFFHENITCLHGHEILLESLIFGKPFIDIILMIQRHFTGCLITNAYLDDKMKYSNYPSLHNCQNSSKLISKHRLIDDQYDCYLKDDETYKNSCLLNDRYRLKCSNETKCLSPVLEIDVCELEGDRYQTKISFKQLCNGIDEIFFFSGSSDKISIDELECELWPCDNMYTRCDGFWTCRNGQDEDKCSRTLCPSGTYACVSPVNYTLICLPTDKVGDQIDHCLGASDELRFYRSVNMYKEDSLRFRCFNGTSCLKSSELCDNVKQCPLGDDEKFCGNHRFTCSKSSYHNRSVVEDLICGLSENEKKGSLYFSLDTSSNFPSLENSLSNEIMDWFTNRTPSINTDETRLKDNPWPWYCNRGLDVYLLVKNASDHRACICPPSYYGHLCQYQNERVSLTLQLSSTDRRSSYAIVSMLIDDNDERQKIESYDKFVYVVKESCSIKINRYLLFSTRPKNLSKNYSIRIDAIEINTLTHVGSFHLSIPFLFLPVNRVIARLTLSIQPVQISSTCLITCSNGQCIKYLNKNKYFCRCFSGWSGIRCNLPIDHQMCSTMNMSIGSVNNQSICICPMNKFEPQCLFTSTCPINACQNGGQCIPADVSIPKTNYICVCLEQFFGPQCQYLKARIDISVNDMTIPPYLLAYFFTVLNESEPVITTMLQKLTLFQRVVTFRITVPFHLVIVKVVDRYYLAALQKSPKIVLSTSISPSQECMSIEDLFNSTVLKMARYRRIKLYHTPCQSRLDLKCFIDEVYLCLCTNERHVNCVDFDRSNNFLCSSNDSCKNGAQCLQDHSRCPSAKICVCPNCFFGNQCQFYAKGLGSTLDKILGYEIRRNTILSKQSFPVKVSCIITMGMFLVGIINGILSILTFSRVKSREAGCGIYLLASSITSILSVTLFTLKFWFLYLSHQDLSGQKFLLDVNCLCIEPLLKLVIYMDNWLNACVAIERSVSAFQGISFNKQKSKLVAKCVIFLLLLIITGLFIPQMSYLHVFNDEKEERSWCVISYTRWLYIYSSSQIFFHYFAPLLINLLSAIFIIIFTAHQRVSKQSQHSLLLHLSAKLKKYKQLLISSAILVILTFPQLIISIILDCNKSSYLFWFYLTGYFLSFVPSIFVFVIFVIPSPLYKEQFIQMILNARRKLNIFKMKFSRI